MKVKVRLQNVRVVVEEGLKKEGGKGDEGMV